MSEDMLKWVIGGLVTAIGTLFALNNAYIKSDREKREQTLTKLQEKNENMYKEEKERHKEEEKELKEEIKSMQLERKEERKEWLGGLSNIADAVNNLSENFNVKINSLEKDVNEIKEKIK